ncbi:MAG: hypothetical protein J6Y10_01325 [Lachnospiraceae bacterium]|nr:hypothetical protein [Lachnospiraceae bacterium]
MEKRMTEQKLNKLLKTTNLYKEANRRYHELMKLKEDREQSLSKAPSGKIHIVKLGKKVQYYLRNQSSEKGGTYISKKETEKIKTYVQKAYDEKILKEINKELQTLRHLAKKPEGSTNRIRQTYSNNPAEIKAIINPIDVSDEDYIANWIDTPYEGKELSDQLPFYETKRKERVRSKSELNIANILEAYGIPYKYECPLTLSSGKLIYPDFTVLNVRERKVYYWEHRGMMDDREYANQAVFKMKQLRKSGICLGDNLIITEETSANPLGTDEIKCVIKQLLL